MNCTTKNVIYSIICPKCGQFYIGQTRNELCLRMNLHRQQTTNEEHRFLKVNRHLHECASNKFNIFPLYKITNNSDSFRDEMQQRLIEILKPELNAWICIVKRKCLFHTDDHVLCCVYLLTYILTYLALFSSVTSCYILARQNMFDVIWRHVAPWRYVTISKTTCLAEDKKKTLQDHKMLCCEF